MNKKSNIYVEIILMAFLLFVVAIGAYDLGQKKGSSLERISPADRIELGNLSFTEDRVCIHYKNLTVHETAGTNSMEPIIDNGTHTIHYTPANKSEVKVGDIVSYWYGDQLVVHRVIEIDGNNFRAKGDNNRMFDPWTSLDNIESILIGIIY